MPSAALNGALDIVVGHVLVLGGEDGGAQARIGTGSPPPTRVAMVNSRMSLVKILPRLASVAAFLCLIVAHFECPDMVKPSIFGIMAGVKLNSCRVSLAAASKSGNRAEGYEVAEGETTLFYAIGS